MTAERGCGPLSEHLAFGSLIPPAGLETTIAKNKDTRDVPPASKKPSPSFWGQGQLGVLKESWGVPWAPSVLLLVRGWGAWVQAQEEGWPQQATVGQQVGAQRIQHVAHEEAGPGILWHTVGEGCAQVRGGTHV